MAILNLGIVAHVDAGKTSLTERLLYDAGVLDELGSVDSGSTRTDTLDLERRRGITISAAVVSFPIGDLKVNLIDTPGHSDFIAEVERALHVLDGVILVVSAVEGVQAQTRILLRTLERLKIPTLIFVNKFDRSRRRDVGLRRLTPRAVAFDDEGLIEVLAEHDDRFLSSFVDGVPIGVEERWRELGVQTAEALVYPVFFGSAMTGEGVSELMRGIHDLLPAARPGDDLDGTVFKIERGPSGEKVAYVRMYGGTIRVRDAAAAGKVTAIEGFRHGETVRAGQVDGGDIAKLWGLAKVRIGDQLGGDARPAESYFAPPTLETVIRAVDPAEGPVLDAALRTMAEQDPFINLRRDGAMSIRLYGEVQKEIVEARLADDFGVRVSFSETRTVYIEKPCGVGEALLEISKRGRNDIWATVGLRIEPGAGVRYRLGVERGLLPLAFHTAIEETVHSTLYKGPSGWEVTDCLITLTRCGFAAPISTAGDFRKATALVLRTALARAGTEVHEPMHHFELELPPDSTRGALAKLAEAGATLEEGVRPGFIEGVLPASQVYGFERRVPALTQGEGVFLSRFVGYRLVRRGSPRAG
jgi:ribosomal protection tetracycline resistance protein